MNSRIFSLTAAIPFTALIASGLYLCQPDSHPPFPKNAPLGAQRDRQPIPEEPAAEPPSAQSVRNESLPRETPRELAAQSEAPLQNQPAVELPLVFIQPDATLKLSQAQVAALDELARSFIAALGGAHRNPNDPEYLERWRAAEPDANRRLKLLVGSQAYLIYQRTAMRQKAGDL